MPLVAARYGRRDKLQQNLALGPIHTLHLVLAVVSWRFYFDAF